MEQFHFTGRAEILHLNTRKEGPDDDKVLAADVKLRTTTSRDVLGFFEPAIAAALFLDSGAVRNPMMGPITFTHEMEHYRMETFGSTFSGCKLKKFAMEPKDTSQIVLTFQVSFQPSGDEVAQLAEYLQDEIELALIPESGDLLA